MPRDEANVDLHEARLAPSQPLSAWLQEDHRRFRDFARAYLACLPVFTRGTRPSQVDALGASARG